MNYRTGEILLFLLFMEFSRVLSAVPLGDFYPYGTDNGDTLLPREDDDSSPEITVSPPFSFFGSMYSSLYVNTNGVLSFNEKFESYKTKPFPLNDSVPLIAPFWADVDTEEGGDIYYRISTDADLLDRASREIEEKVLDDYFMATWMFIVTWVEIAFYDANEEGRLRRNTFQCVLVTDGYKSYTIFSYNRIEWITGDGDDSTGLGGTAAQIMSTYRCQYCKKSTEQFKPIIEHLISDHDDKEMKFLKQFRSAIRTNNFRIIPKQCQNEGRSITILSEEDKIHVSRKTIFIPESPLKKIQKEDVNAASTNSLSAEYQQYSAESDEIEHADEIDDDVMSDSAENDNDMEEMISLLPIVMEELKKANKLEEYISFHRLVSESKFPLQNIAYLLFNDVVRWFSLEQSSHMRYSNEVKLFWRTGLRLFHGKFLRFMGGSKGTGQIVNKQSTPGLCSTTTSNINFVVPNRNALAEEKKFVNESKPGIFNEMIKSLADSDFTDNTKTYKVCVDGKKINLSSNGEVDLWGYEDKPTKEEKNERTKREIELVIRLKEHALKQIAFGHVFTHDCNLESKILIPELCTEIVTILSDRLKDLRLLKVKKNLFLNSLLEKSGSNWQKSHLVMVISSMKTTLYSIQNLIEDLLQVIGTLCKFASQMLQSDMNYSNERFVQMNTQSNFICLSNGERDLTDPSLVKQRSHQWHELRKNYTVTGSTIQAAIGLNGIKKQKEYLENKEKGNQQENDVQLQSRFEHGNKNEPNAVATIVSKFLPAFYPHLSFYEEGCYELTDKDTSLLVSPDGSLRDPKIESRIEFGVEIKCPLPGKLYTTDVHYSIPWYYVPQILSEMNALNVKSLFFVSYSMESTTIQHAHFDEPIWNNIQSEIRIVNLGQRQKILKERILPLKQKIMEYCKTKVKLVAEVPSCNAVPCSHKESDEEHRLYHSPSERSENSALCLSQIERTCLKISNLIKDCHTLCAIKASEVLVFLLSDLDRTYKAAIPHAMPIAYALKGFSMKTDAMQKMICDVRKALFINGMYTPIVSFDGQWSKLAFQKSTDEPLTLLELQKKVYNKVKRKTTSELRSIIFHSGEINANTFEEIRCKVHYEKGKNGITVGYNENQSFIKTSIHLHGILRELKVKSSPIESTVNTQCNIPIEEVISDLPANVIASIDDDFMDELAVVNVQSLDRHEQERREMPDTDYCDLQNLFTEDPVVNSCLDQMSRRNETDGNKDSKMDFENIADQCTGTGDEETQQIQDEPTISDHILEMIFPKLQHSKWARKWTIDTVSFLSIMKTKSSISAKFTIPELICFAEAYNEFGYEKIKVYKSWNKDRIVEEIYKACTSNINNVKTNKRQKLKKTLTLKVISQNVIKTFPKKVLNIIVSENIFNDEVRLWRERSPFDIATKIEGIGKISWFSIPEYSEETMTYVFTCLDVHHLITNCRVKVCKDGLPERQIVKDAWLEVARTNSTKLKISHVEDLVDKQSDAIAKTTFSTEVQSVMEQLGYKNEADFCRLVRNFYEAEDDPGINALQRCLRRLEFRDWLLKDVNFGKFPPFGSHILGLPQVMFQGFLTNIERRIQIFPFIKSGCYNVRSLGSLEAENFFGEFQDLDPKGSGVIKAEEIPVALEMACQLNHTRLRDDRPFHMSLSRAKVYPFHELEQECPKDNENMATDSYLYPSHVGNIVPKNHIFDAKLRAKRKAKRKKVEITGPNDAARGVAPVRQHHKCDESKILPHKRLGINIL